MKATVKDFILESMTDRNFEKLVNTLVIEDARRFYFHEDELLEAANNYLNIEKTKYPQDNTFEVLNEIKKVSTVYKPDYRVSLGGGRLQDLRDLNDTSMLWMPSELNKEKTTAIADDKNIIGMPESKLFQEMNIALIPETYTDYEGIAKEMTMENYKEVLQNDKILMALGLANFIYEVMHYTNNSKLLNQLEEFPDETSHVKIAEDPDYAGRYEILFLLDNRTRYVPAELQESYRNLAQSVTIDDLGIPLREDLNFELSILPPGFVEYSGLMEDLDFGPTDILAPFTFYLNEDLIVPKLSDEVLYEILGQLVHVLTFQGFIKEEQIDAIKEYNKNYLLNIV